MLDLGHLVYLKTENGYVFPEAYTLWYLFLLVIRSVNRSRKKLSIFVPWDKLFLIIKAESHFNHAIL